jgi:two-component system, OmpR family, sensor histidine kinase SaeS
MKLRTYLLLANAVSIVFLLIFLIISFDKMLLNIRQFIWISTITFAVGVLSVFLHFLMIRPLEKSVRMIVAESKKIALGNYHAQVPVVGPVEFKKMANQFNEMSTHLEVSFNRLRDSEVSRRELIANVSHDLRTPLASIQSYVEALQDGVIVDKETYQKYLSTIQTESIRLGHLINDLFELSRLDAGVEEFQPELYPLEDLIVEKLKSFALQFEHKKLQVSVFMPDDSPLVQIMPFKIKRVFANLLENAIRYAPDESRIEITVTPHQNQFIEVSVADQGEGIGEIEQTQLFERFYRTDKSRNRHSGGAGLGLAIAKSVIELHGGHVGVESVKGEGSRFWFTLPKVHFERRLDQ